MTKFEIEYPIKSSVKVLYDGLTDSSKLTEWFCDEIRLMDNGNRMEFFWDGSGQIAKIVSKKENKFIRFHWEDEDDETYFEMKIQIDEITNGQFFTEVARDKNYAIFKIADYLYKKKLNEK